MAPAKNLAKSTARTATESEGTAPAQAKKTAAVRLPRAAVPAGPLGPAETKGRRKKPRLVRDSFTIPKAEYAMLDALKRRATEAGVPARKSEVLRAGIQALLRMSDAAYVTAVGAVAVVKPGPRTKA